MEPSVDTFAGLAERIMVLPARLGPVRLVAVDGFAGSGKTTFAGRLATALRAPVVHTDDLLEGWTDIVAFWPRLEAWVLDPLRAGRPGRYRRFDWLHDRFATRWHDVPVAPTLVLEGVTAARAEIRPELTLSIWIAAPQDLRLQRGLLRDGEASRAHWERWQRAELEHAAADRAADSVDLVVDGAADLDRADGFRRLR